MYFLDVGSNKGIFIDQWNASASDSTRFALAFEPNPDLKIVLEKKITRGKLVQKAVSDKKGTAEFKIYASDNSTSSLMNRSDMMPHFTDGVANLKVEIDTLDSYLPLIQEESKKGVFVKIDVEGVELLVLQGAKNNARGTTRRFSDVRVFQGLADRKPHCKRCLPSS